jgi:probable rRNA maturation factor
MPDEDAAAARTRVRRASRLRVDIRDERGRAIRSRGLSSWLARVAPPRARGSVVVALVSDARVRALNKRYRRKDYATDVLSFPAGHGLEKSAQHEGSLGDIVIARGVARRQARDAHHPESTELRILALHGLLHLLGYDHERDNGTMQNAERRLRREGGLREGLIERARRPVPDTRERVTPRSASGAGVGPRAQKK